MILYDVFDTMIQENASDAIIRVDSPLRLRVYSELKTVDNRLFTEKEINAAVTNLLSAPERDALEHKRGCDGAITYKDQWRFRIGIFYQQGRLAMVARKINLCSLNFDDLHLPAGVLERLCHERRGLILLVGMTGSGKSTTIATMIEYINQHFGRHILTVEEPIEYIFKDKLSMINQREVGRDVMDYEDALKQIATQSPDILYVGDIRDAHICSAVLKAAEKGLLVISTLHSVNAQTTVETLVNLFPAEQHDRLFGRLSLLLKGIIAQRLVPREDQPGLIPAYEVMTLSPTIANVIAEKKIGDIPKLIREGVDQYGMNTYNQCLLNLIREKKISRQNALQYSDNKKDIELMLTYDVG